ncbi:MAG: methyltransferase domain-containing protein [Pacificimonas sp.]
MGLYSEWLFPKLCDKAMRAETLQERRRSMLSSVSGDVLEIGFGTGLSARHYPSAVTRLTAVEPSEGMNETAKARIEAAAVPIRLLPLAGESLPVEDESMDHVTCSLTLCSVDDPTQVLAEIRRVLKPGGRFHFIEHVLSEDPNIARWQSRLNPLQRVIGVGCNLDRDSQSMIRAAGFELPDLRQEREDALPFSALFPVVQGVAVKPAA